MKYYLSLVLLVLLAVSGCKTEIKKEQEAPVQEMTILEKVAYAHGYENWKKVKEIRFTFNVDRDTSHFERAWQWNLKGNDVMTFNTKDTLSYNRMELDSASHKTNSAFINDKYWLLAPLNILWDKDNISYEHHVEVQAPISKTSMQQLTIVYGKEGGYTPGDAYDFYFGDDYIIKEWVWRKENQTDASLATTWEDYVEKGGMKIARMHKNAEGNLKLYMSDIQVKTK